MKRKVTGSILTGLLIFSIVMISGCTEKGSKKIKRVVSENLIAQIDHLSWTYSNLTTSPDGKRLACVAQLRDKMLVDVDGKEGKKYDGI